MIKTIIFDVDGVLLHHELLFSEGLIRNGATSEAIQMFWDQEYQDCIIDKADIKETLAKYIPLWNYPGTVDELLNYWFGKTRIKKNEELLQAISDMRAQGIACYLGTNNEKYRMKYILDELNFRDYFDGIFASGHMGYAKPDPAFWQVVHETLGKPSKDEVLFWDDVEKNVASAKEFGFHAELYTDFPSYQEKIKFFLN
jgi:putative hydrolase of the HAD superfamily